jgi:HSP90 family molecular chaperone
MRDLGYSLETAVADLIDNSISAEAAKIEIVCEIAVESPYLAIIDNGHGMSRAELINAMKHGSASPKTKRGTHDLGRFGLGMKTASFSQCRSLTVASLKQGEFSGAEWNLDRIDREDDWILSILDEQEMLGGTTLVTAATDCLAKEPASSFTSSAVWVPIASL